MKISVLNDAKLVNKPVQIVNYVNYKLPLNYLPTI
jgi:hypothetical protein